jgi:hypothetical protein
MTMPKKSQTNPADEKAPEALVWIGPNCRTGNVHLTTHQVFRGGLPDPVRALAEADPTAARLLVPVSGLAQARAALADPTSDLARVYRDALKAQERK